MHAGDGEGRFGCGALCGRGTHLGIRVAEEAGQAGQAGTGERGQGQQVRPVGRAGGVSVAGSVIGQTQSGP